jgi:hypothetical protein
MKQLNALLLLSLLAALFVVADTADADRRTDRRAARHAQGMSFHGPYYSPSVGAPLALVVPPTAHMQVKWGWGVSQGTMTPIYHQFRRSTSGGGGAGGMEMNPTPRWPSHSDQFGVNYIRGPW